MTDPIHPFLFRHPVSAASHLLYAAWALYALLLMRRLVAPSARPHATCFGVCLVLLYLASGLYHAVPADRPDWVERSRLLDLSAIHLLIAGTCTAAFAVLPARARRTMSALVWSVAVAGILSKWLLPLPPARLTVGLYVAAGLLGMLPLAGVARAAGPGAGWLVGGALAYAAGAACEAARWPVLWPGVVGPHELLHLGDMLGSTAHVVFVVRCLGPTPGRDAPDPRQ